MQYMKKYTSITATSSTKSDKIKTVGELKTGEWQKISYTFVCPKDMKYVAISTTPGNDMYFDDITVTLYGYTGSATGDTSVSPLIMLALVMMAVGAVIVTSRKVFAK